MSMLQLEHIAVGMLNFHLEYLISTSDFMKFIVE